jgi:hypothetical protein
MTEWRGVVAGLPNTVNEGNPLGKSVEGKFAVEKGWVFVQDSAGRRLGARQLLPDEDAKSAARGILRGAAKSDPCSHLFFTKGSSW